jgi:hypothetical protein
MNETSFHFEERLHEGRALWTSRFTCPKTNEVYEAGTFAEKQSLYDTWKWSKGDQRVPVEFDSRLYYSSLKTAMHAAAARRLDAIQFEAGGSKIRKYCEEDPELPTDPKVEESSQLEASSVEAASVVEATSVVIEEDSDQQEEHSHHDGSLLYINAIKSSPMNSLHNYYNAKNKKTENFEMTLHKEPNPETGEPALWWSSKFECPLSGKKYTSGSLRSEILTFDAGNIQFLDRKPYYSDSKWAKQAVAANVLDDIQFELSGTTEPRLCHEDPSLPATKGSAYKPPEDQMLTRQSKPKETAVGVTNLDETEVDDYMEDMVEELILQSVSTSLTNSSTLDRLMEAWSDSIATTEEAKTSSPEASLPLMWTPSQERIRILSEAKSWLNSLKTPEKKMDRFVRFQNPLQVSTLASGNVILSVLAKANQIRNGSDVQEIADLVFNFLWSGPKPNADTYSNYMQCLSGDPQKVAQMAQEILDEMLSGTTVAGNRIPTPTVEVFNTVVKLWAWAGDAAKCQKVFASMESSNIEVNRDTCIHMLSCLAHGTFDSEHATAGITAMKEAGLWDADAQYAPLRWSGKHIEAKVFPWDKLSDIYSNGFKESPSDGVNAEAEAVDEWVTSIEESDDVEITTGCYEAVIQAWIRTGTRQGLVRAEEWALRSFNATSDGKLQPRLQTFYPIIAALALGGEGPAAVAERISQLQEWSDTYPQLRPDGRINSILLLSRRRHVESLMAKSEDIDTHFESAQAAVSDSLNELTLQCDQLVGDHSGDKEGPPIFLETSAFFDALFCLRSYGQGAAKRMNAAEADATARSILKVASQFQITLKRLHAIAEKEKASLGEERMEETVPVSPILDLQMKHFLDSATSVYNSALRCVNDIHNEPTEEGNTTGAHSVTATNLPEIESLLRSSEECRRLLLAQSATSVPTEVYFSDHFSYHNDGLEYTDSSQFDLCSKVVKAVTESGSHQNVSDQVRVLALVVDILLEETKSTTDRALLSALCLKMIEFIQSNARPDEKEALLQYFLRTISGKTQGSIGVVDVSPIAKTAKIRFRQDWVDSVSRHDAFPKPAGRSSSGSPKPHNRNGKRRQRRTSK